MTETPTLPPPTAAIESTPSVLPTQAAPPRAQYTFYVVLDYATKSVTVDQTILYPNQTGAALPDIVLAVVPNFWSDCFVLSSLSMDGAPVSTYALEGQRLSIYLPQPLPAGASVTLSLQYSLALPEIVPINPNQQRPRIFGYSARQVNLVNWYPFIVSYAAGARWLLHDPWFYGEHLVYDVADFEVNIRPTDATVQPVIAASGAAEPNGEWRRYRLEKGRAFAISASTEFQVASASVGGVSVYSYYFPLFKEAGDAVLQTSTQAVQVFSERYGPYPHATLSAVQGDFNDGMEYSAFYFLPLDFYNLYDGTPNGYLTAVAAHETAHQWWFEQVANDQALEPWLDEALCTYSEYIYYENAVPAALDNWWWPVRINFYQPKGWVDMHVYDGGGFRPYTDAVYFRGAYFLNDLRIRIGDEAFFAFLQDYLAQENGRIATAADFFRILRQHTSADISDLVATYFQNPH